VFTKYAALLLWRKSVSQSDGAPKPATQADRKAQNFSGTSSIKKSEPLLSWPTATGRGKLLLRGHGLHFCTGGYGECRRRRKKMGLQPSPIVQVVEDFKEQPLERRLLMFQVSWEETAELRVSGKVTLAEMTHKMGVIPNHGGKVSTKGGHVQIFISDACCLADGFGELLGCQ